MCKYAFNALITKRIMYFLRVFIVFIQFSILSCNLNITDASNKIKLILNKYSKSLKCNHRFQRCLKTEKMNTFVGKTLNFVDKTERYGDFLRYSNVSDCDSVNSESYRNVHILKGLIHKDMPETHWHEYKAVHKKEYSSIHHEMAALKKWRNNLKLVTEHNQQYLTGETSYSLHLNHFADLSATEYFRKILKLFHTTPMYDPAEDHHRTAYRRSLKNRVPDKVDWRRKGFKPRREKQSDCGACYAFAVAHALQAQMYKKHRKWGELSPQQIVDCSHNDGNMGCDGGSIRAALRYVARNGLITENYYPYSGTKGHCRYSRRLVSVTPRRWAMLPPRDEEAMERALSSIGPLAVGVNAAPFTFQLYSTSFYNISDRNRVLIKMSLNTASLLLSLEEFRCPPSVSIIRSARCHHNIALSSELDRSGIYDDPFCLPWQLNHAMLLVGYTPEYWILLNWWGKDWGEDGYMRIRRGFNRCGVANMAAYVEL